MANKTAVSTRYLLEKYFAHTEKKQAALSAKAEQAAQQLKQQTEPATVPIEQEAPKEMP
jgi:hypothetical protein